MDEPQSTSSVTSPPSTASSWPMSWMVIGMVATLALSLIAAHAPARIRLLGLFSIAFGLIVGWLLNRLVELLDAHPSRHFIRLVAATLTLCGLVGSTCEQVRLETLKRPGTPKEEVAQRLIDEMQMSGPANHSPQNDSLSEFRKHLSVRIRKLGVWSSPWPEAFWIAEVCAGAFASSWMASRGQNSDAQS